MTMLSIKEIDNKQVEVLISLPEGKTAEELLLILKEEMIKLPIEKLHGKEILIYGRISVVLAAALAVHLKNISRGIYFYVPRECKYVKVA